MSKKKSKKDQTKNNSAPQNPNGRPELIVMAHSDAEFRVAHGREASAKSADVAPLEKVLSLSGAKMTPLFGESEDRVRAAVAELSPDAQEGLSELSTFYHIEAPEERLDELAEQFRDLEPVSAAYVKPAAELAECTEEDDKNVNQMEPKIDDAPAATPNFTSRQIYLNPAPEGIDARHAWAIQGGRGDGVRIIDLEWGWNFNHEDLLQNEGGVVAGTNSSNNNHGTAVLGEYSGDQNSFGVTGICPNAIASAVAFSMPTATAIRIAADRLRAGDIMLLEIHRPGPNATGSGQFGFIAVEWWPDDFAAIRYAVNKGILVVEAAGNGAQNFDAAIYNTPASGFPSSWRNPFNPANPSSGAIVVGAGAPPPGTHGRDHGPDRSRLGFSNYGRRVDCQGWGREVTTTGYGDLQGGANRDRWYTDTFSGTSSASPIVVGTLGCLQGILRSRGATPLTPNAAIQLLRSTGSPQQDAPGRPKTQRIGNRPDLRQLVQALPSPTRFSGVFRAGSGSYGLWANSNWSSFRQKWQQWSSQGMRLIDFDTTGSGSSQRYSGVFRQGSGAHGLWVNASWNSFRQKWQQWNSQGLRLVDFEISGTGSQRRYSGVFRGGTGSYGLWVNASWQSFVRKWRQWNRQGLRLIDLKINGSGSQTRYSGVFRKGSGSYGLWANASWSSFVQKWREWNSRGLRLVDLEVIRNGNQTRYSGVFRQGSGAYALWANTNWQSFVAKWQQLNSQGLRLIDLDITWAGASPEAPFALGGPDTMESTEMEFGQMDEPMVDQGVGQAFFDTAHVSEEVSAELEEAPGFGYASIDESAPDTTDDFWDFDAKEANGFGESVLSDESATASESNGKDGTGQAIFEDSPISEDAESESADGFGEVILN